MTLQEAKQALSRKLDIDYSDIANNDMFSDTDLEEWVNEGALRAWDYRRWEFTEGARTGSLTSTEMTNGYVAMPNNLSTGSLFLLKIGGKEYDKINFRDYQLYLENESGGSKKFFAEFKRLIFFNTNVPSAGDAIDIWGKLKFERLTTSSDLLPFSPDVDNEDYSGNNAIVLLAYAEALGSEKKKNPQQAQVEEGKAFRILDSLWNQQVQGRALEQSHNRPYFSVPDMFRTGNRRSDTGKFNWDVN